MIITRAGKSACEKLLASFSILTVEFYPYAIQLKKYKFKQIEVVDQNLVFFTMPWNYTLNPQIIQEVKTMSIGYEKQYVTLMICITVVGQMWFKTIFRL